MPEIFAPETSKVWLLGTVRPPLAVIKSLEVIPLVNVCKAENVLATEFDT